MLRPPRVAAFLLAKSGVAQKVMAAVLKTAMQRFDQIDSHSKLNSFERCEKRHRRPEDCAEVSGWRRDLGHVSMQRW